VAIDEAVRESAHRQVVILGAGLDGRAWRMPELKDAVVFEVDHPDTQRAKRSRLASLTSTAREIRFVAVDFTRDSLEACLATAGHDPALATSWIWEGVVMYLTPEQVEATLTVIAKRSTAGSRLSVLYHAPALMLRVVGLVVRRMGEPLRSSYTPDSLNALLRRYGFEVARDENPPMLAARLGRELSRRVRMVKHLRVAVADRLA
jgi:methyltransferase (TIGR00027 family)